MTASSEPRVFRSVVVALVLLLAASIVVAVGHADPASAAAPRLRVSNSTVISGEATSISGKLARGKRPVKLQMKVRSRWKTVAGRKTAPSGAFAFAVRPRVTSVYRVYAPRAKVGRKKRAAVATRAVRVTIVRQTASATTLPGIAQPGTTAAASSAAQDVVGARFSPARPGRTVVLQRRVGSSWSKIGTARQNSYGSAAFKLSSIPAGTLRVVALALRGAPAAVGYVSRVAWTQRDVNGEFSGTSSTGTLPDGWVHRKPGYPGGLRQCARGSADMVKVTNGVLEVSTAKDGSPQKANCDSTHRDGHIGTESTFTYGLFAARVKFQQGRGHHGAFWVQSSQETSGSEIDVAEYFGRGRSDYGLTQFIHYPNSKGVGQTSGTITDRAYQVRTRQALAGSSDDWWKSYHVFSAEWSPGGYVFRIDGVETFRTSAGKSALPGQVILSLLTSDWEAPQGDGSKQTMYVDWVNVWQR